MQRPTRPPCSVRVLVSPPFNFRLILMLAGLLLVLFAILLGVFRPPTQLFVFVLLLNYAMPTAVNMSVRVKALF